MPSSGIGSLILLALPLLLLVYVFSLSRRGQRQTQALQQAIAVGDEVVTTSGMYGRIVDLDAEVATLEISQGIRVRFVRRAIGALAPSATDDPGTATGQED